MKTYLSVWFNTNGENPSNITKKLAKIGFKPIRGNYDYEYDWKRTASVDEILNIGDKLQQMLKGSNVLFKLETV